MTSRTFRTSWGANVGDKRSTFALWAPKLSSIDLVSSATGAREAMIKVDNGWFQLETDLVAVGDGYSFGLPDGKLVPDPAARAQVGDVHGPSRLIDPKSYAWQTDDWIGRPWEEAVIYELHTGAFTQAGTFDGIRGRLDYLQKLGVTAIELMPIAQFSGSRGWGYDGVLHYAPHQAYGSPDDLKRLVDEAHARSLMVILDVVYNHFGPDGNYIGLYAPEFFHPELQTPWGSAIAYDQPSVRKFFIENALYWLDEYRFDGLRLDAVDQIVDVSKVPFLEELAATVRQQIPDRHIHLTTEDDRNIIDLHARDDAGQAKLFTAEWNDDFHHVVHTLVTGESDGYYADYAPDAARHLCRALTEGYVYQGEPSVFREGEPRGQPSSTLPPSAFINFLQNHDQIGNRAFGDRLASLVTSETLDVVTALLLLSPFTPLMFMGDEWAERRAFLYFTDFDGELGRAVREGRRNEFRKWRAFSDPGLRETIPDPNALETAHSSAIDWSQADFGANSHLALVQRLLDVRATEIAPRIKDIRLADAKGEVCGAGAIFVQWRLGPDEHLDLYLNLAPEACGVPALDKHAKILFASRDDALKGALSGTLPGVSIVVACGAVSNG
jgi:malto-oligosyltrehalose trehalohydrolase